MCCHRRGKRENFTQGHRVATAGQTPPDGSFCSVQNTGSHNSGGALFEGSTRQQAGTLARPHRSGVRALQRTAAQRSTSYSDRLPLLSRLPVLVGGQLGMPSASTVLPAGVQAVSVTAASHRSAARACCSDVRLRRWWRAWASSLRTAMAHRLVYVYIYIEDACRSGTGTLC